MVAPKLYPSHPNQFQRRSTAGRCLVCFLVVCSAILLFKSYRLESFRFEALIRSSVTTSRTLPEEASGVNIIDNSEFYVPSLDYRIKGVSQYSSSAKADFEAHVYCKEFEKDLLWEWWRPDGRDGQKEVQRRSLRRMERRERETKNSMSVDTTETNGSGNNQHTTRKRLLIGITSGYDDRARLLERAIWSARVYGALWSGETPNEPDVTVVTLQGTSFSPHGCKAPPSHSSIDKIRVLFEAIDSEPRYDRLLLLDADTMIYKMNLDLTSLLDNDDFVVVGPPILTEDGKRNKNKPWEISSGMTLWNLEHPLTKTFALDWFNKAKNAIIRGSYQSDQKYLHKVLQQYYSTNQDGIVKRNSDRNIGIVQALSDDIFDEDSRGTVVKKFGVRTETNVKHGISSANNKQIEERLTRMEETAREICIQYSDACKQVGAPPRYETF